jgi:hypothetical protein
LSLVNTVDLSVLDETGDLFLREDWFSVRFSVTNRFFRIGLIRVGFREISSLARGLLSEALPVGSGDALSVKDTDYLCLGACSEGGLPGGCGRSEFERVLRG